MITVVDSTGRAAQLRQLRAWFEAQWGAIDPLIAAAGEMPEPLLALDANQRLIGGLAFTLARTPTPTPTPTPSGGREACWINALYVVPASRRSGVASQLIRSAMSRAASLDVDELFVYTSAPELYVGLGWSTVQRHDGNTVLHTVL